MSQQGVLSDATSPAADIEKLTGDSGGAVGPDGSFNVNIVGGTGITTVGTPGTNTITLNASAGEASITKYVVDADGSADYTTIQAALTAANTAGVPASVYVRPGAYTEDLTLYSDIILEGDQEGTIITGNHTVPNGTITVRNLSLIVASGNAFSGTGTTGVFTAENLTTSCTAYTFSLGNWDGTVILNNIETFNTANDGFLTMNGLSTATVIVKNCYHDSLPGTGTNDMTIQNVNLIHITGCTIKKEVTFLGNTNAFISNCFFTEQIRITSTVTLSMYNTTIDSTTALPVILHDSSNTLILGDVTLKTSNNPAIGGTGTIEFGSVTFIDSDVIAGTITQNLTTSLKTGQIRATNIENLSFSGRLSWGGAGNYYSVAANVVTVLRPGTGYIMAKEVTWTAPQSTAALAAGSTYFLYIDSTGTLQTTTTRSTALFQDNIVLLEALVDSSGVPNVIVVREDHPYDYPSSVSEWAHDTIGVVIANKNNGANIVLNGTKAIEISGADELEDHGLETDIPDSGGAAVTFSFMYTNGAGKWVRNTTANTFSSDYNNAGVVTALGVNKYGIFRLYVSKDDLNSSTPTYYAVYDDQEYNNLVQAQVAIAAGTPAAQTAELAMLELAQLGYVIKEESSDTIVDVIIEKDTARSATTGASSNQSSLILNDTTNFDGWLSAADTSVQAALETLDEVQKGTTFSGAVSAPTFDTDVAAAALTMSGTAIAADGTDVNIDVDVNPKGTGVLDVGSDVHADGISFDSGSNTLANFEESTWTPQLEFGGGTTGITYLSREGSYSRIGRLVILTCDIQLTSKGTDVGDATITGAPYAAVGRNYEATARPQDITLNTGGGFYSCAVQMIGSSTINCVEIGSANTPSSLNNANFADTSQIGFTLIYKVS